MSLFAEIFTNTDIDVGQHESQVKHQSHPKVRLKIFRQKSFRKFCKNIKLRNSAFIFFLHKKEEKNNDTDFDISIVIKKKVPRQYTN